MATNYQITIDQVVARYALKYKVPQEDMVILTEHCANCVRDYYIYDAPDVVSEKVSISALGIIEMPDDMIGFNGLFIPLSGELWAFTEKDTIVNTTTTTLAVEGQDSDFGEGVAITDPKTDTYGGVGGVNDYYYTIDWGARRIFCEGITSDTVLLRYTTSGITASGTTYIPEFITPMLDAYMLWKSSYWMPALRKERELLERDFIRTEAKIRNLINSMTYAEWKDLLNSIATQSPQR